MAHKKQGKAFVNVCVVGLSGYDITYNCLYGVGKSCFCNRFMTSAQDNFVNDHTSIFSTSDFVGTVINNDHFLYWGQVEKKIDDHTTVTFRLLEQTEFIDDASYCPLSRGGQLVPYPKRATATKLLSPGKIMYISRDQVALQTDYEQVQMDRDGKIQVDGFICIYDVSKDFSDKTNHTDIQENLLTLLLTNISKSKKPVVVVATKCEQSNEYLLSRAHQYVHTKKLAAPLIESSADCFVNIELAFYTLYQLIDTKTRGYRAKLITFQEGLHHRNELIAKCQEKYLSLIKQSASSSSLLMSWSEFCQLHSSSKDYQEFIEVCGLGAARRLFNQQAKLIKQHFEDKRLNEFLNKLPEALDELLPTIQSIEANDWKWEICQQAIKNHILFDKWFQILPDSEYWNSPQQLFSTSDSRIPFDVLRSERSRACFDRHIKKLHESARKACMKIEFRKLLEVTADIRPGTSWAEASQFLLDEESFKYLMETEKKIIFETYLRDITLTAKLDFQELLFESASRFMKLSKDCRPSESEMHNLYRYLQDDPRYKHLENFGNARDILLFNHIALMQSPNRCLSGPDKCMDRLMQQVVEVTTRRATHNLYENDLYQENEDEQINILVIGKDGLGNELESKIKMESSSFDCIEYIVDGQIYGLNIKVLREENLKDTISDFKPQGYLAIFSTQDSWEYIRTSLENIQTMERATQMPLIIMLANEVGTSDEEIVILRTHGQNLATDLDCVFLDYPYTVSLMDDKIHDSQVQDALRRIIDAINKRVRPPSTPSGCDKTTADIRILLCAMCGDEYPIELILGPMLQHHTCYCHPVQQDTIMVEVALDGAKRTISVTLVSYHRAYSLKSQIFHGFILIYSSTRLASLETLRAFASSLPKVPIQALAVTGNSSGASVIFHEETSSLLFNDSKSISNKLHAQFSFQKQAGAFVNFFNITYERRIETELLVQGIKRRRKDPLPEVPHTHEKSDEDLDEDVYTTISSRLVPTPDSPYVEVALRHSMIVDSDLSSPEHKRRMHSPTIESDAFVHVDHDESGLYAKVNKQKFTYIKNLETSDDDDDMVWQDNEAYNTTLSLVQDETRQKQPPDRPYATVPFLPKGHHKNLMEEFNSKYATMPKKTTWSEPDYASIDQLKDDVSSVSTKSKESAGSENLASPLASKPMWHDTSGAWESKPSRQSAPLAKPDDDEQEDIKELSKKLQTTLISKNTIKNKARKISAHSKSDIQSTDTPLLRKNRSESNLSTFSSDPRSSNFIKKLILKVTPNPSPVNSDLEADQPIIVESPSKKPRKNKSMRRAKRISQNIEDSTPTIIVQDGDSRNRSNTLPSHESPKQSTKFSTLDQRKSMKLTKIKKNQHALPEVVLQIPPLDTEKVTQSQTLDRKRGRKWAARAAKVSKDDLDIPGSEQQTNKYERKKKKKPSIKFPSGARLKKRESDIQRREREWQELKSKNQKFKHSDYFGRSLEEICPSDTQLPVFVDNVIKHVENTSMQSEGLYRLSGNKSDIEALMSKFEKNNELNLQALGVSVHAVTGALKNFFKLLPEPLIPPHISENIHEIMIIMDAEVRMEKLRELIEKLPLINRNVFKHFMYHLHRVTEYKSVNKMDARNLQIIVYPTLLRPVFSSLQNMSHNMMGLFIQTCIEQPERIFEAIMSDSMNLNNAIDSDSGLENLTTEPSFLECVLNEPAMDKLMKSPLGSGRTSSDLLSDSDGQLVDSSSVVSDVTCNSIETTID